jgi:hypothetical protein
MFLRRGVLFFLLVLFLSASLSYWVSKGTSYLLPETTSCCTLSVNRLIPGCTQESDSDHENSPCETEETEEGPQEIFLSAQTCCFILTAHKIDYCYYQFPTVSSPFLRIFSPPPEYLSVF